MQEVKKVKDFDSITVSVASPADILSWSTGEVIKPETINYRTQKPEKDGLFCEKIFGPVKNWECACGKYKRIRYKGIVCERCGVEVTKSIVRRERMGHIKLAVPVTHTWFLRSTPSRIGLLLDLSVKQLEQVVYFASYIIIDVDNEAKEEAVIELDKEYQKILTKMKESNASSLKAAKTAVGRGDMTNDDLIAMENSLVEKAEKLIQNLKIAKEELSMLVVSSVLNETQYRDISMKFGHIFHAGIGASALNDIIKKMDLKLFIEELTNDYKNSTGQRQKKIIKRIKLFSSLLKSKINPEWMILSIIPVIPPELRPMVQLDGGRFATSDLNDLYRRVINRNERLKKLIQLGAPEIICRNEKRMLQEAVDILISNSVRNSRTGINYVQKRKLKSLSDMLKGKQGRFRQNLLGKRVDYSGRSVIVVGPTLKLDECGLPKYIALELFKPFVISKLIKFELAHNVKSSEKLIKLGEKVVWDILDEVIKGKYVLLNRAPTLHRLGIQAFQPRLIEGKAIHLHPLVCSAFNADFDGDQMAVHLPLSTKAQREAREIMVSSKNLLKPSAGEPIIVPSQDIILGCYYLTQIFTNKKGTGTVFVSDDEVVLAYQANVIHLQAKIKFRKGSDFIETTAGRILFNRILPDNLEFRNNVFDKKALKDILSELFVSYGVVEVARIVDDIKDIGFKYSTISGISISAFDLFTPENKSKIVEDANLVVEKIDSLFWYGLITNEERYNHTIRVWNKVKSDIMNELIDLYKGKYENDVYYQINSGTRGNWGQITQMVGIKGLVASSSGRTIELPIRSNLMEGFTILEYFIATHGGRKGKSDTALKTAEAGYLTRRLVDSVQDVIVKDKDCHTDIFKTINIDNSNELGVPFKERLYGLVVAIDIKTKEGDIILYKNKLIEEKELKIIEKHKLTSIDVRSMMYCCTLGGVCQYCYGYDLGNRKLVKIGTPVGIIAAQSIGEPGTQLTMRTFHMGGVATEEASISQGLTRVDELFEARSPKNPAILAEISGEINIKRAKNDIKITILADKPLEEICEIKDYDKIVVKQGDVIKEKQIIARSTVNKNILKSTISGEVISVSKKQIIIRQSQVNSVTYTISARILLKVKDGDIVKKGVALTMGHIDLRQLMSLTSMEDVQEYILYEVRYIYASQGQNINEKHIEIITKQMASKVRIEESGDSRYLPGEVCDVIAYDRENMQLIDNKKKPATSERLLLGLTRISLWTNSWLSAASFQETVRVLVEAATTRKVDKLEGLKENVIIGRLIPAGEYYEDFHKKRAVNNNN